MKIAIFHPQINNYGGGETVALTIASALSKNNKVDVLSSHKVNKNKFEQFFDLDLSRVSFKIRKIAGLVQKLPYIHSYKNSLQLRYLNDLNKHDLVIDTGTNGWFTHGLKAKTICYVHFPYFQRKKKGWKTITNPLLIDSKNAFQYDKIVCNSNFTKKYLKKLTNKKIEVIYPPVNVAKINSRKKNIIVTIGRFTYEKKHEVMIKAFKKLNLKGWEFHLIGSFQKNVSLYKKDYFDKLREIAKGHPIYFHVSMPHEKVIKFLSKAKIYWHARGYGETDPNEYENFGITTVEAMATGCVPIVINKGAQPEIVKHGKNGYLWNKPEELIFITRKVIGNYPINIRKTAKIDSKRYDNKNFISEIKQMVNQI